MELTDGTLSINWFMSMTLGMLVLFIGRGVNQNVKFLQDFNIPEPVTGGLLVSLLFAAVYFTFDIATEFDLNRRDVMLVYFFTTIGINAKLSDLLLGGKPLAILLVAVLGYMVVQDLVGVTVATALGQPSELGLLGGTVSLIGGHGTAIAWAPTFAEEYGIENALEIGVACATFGLILASLMGGPIAKYLIYRHKLEGPTAEEDSGQSVKPATPETGEEPLDGGHNVGLAPEKESMKIDYYSFVNALFALHCAIILGLLLNELVESWGLKLPLFVTCLFGGIILTNIIPHVLRRYPWPARTPAMALIAEFSLGIFLAMSLMSMQLWVILDLAGPILTILLIQFVIAGSLCIFVVYRLMGSNYDAAVICSGFGGITLGSTATAMANMTAVTKRYGNSHLAFVVVPLVCAFFVDIFNAFLIRFFLDTF